MKKLFTIFGLGALCASTAMAAPQVAQMEYTIPESTLKMIQAPFKADLNVSSTEEGRVYKKVSSDGKWLFQASIVGEAGEIFAWGEDGVNLTIEEMPFYVARFAYFSAVNGESDNKTSYQGVLFWPTRYMFDQWATYDGPMEDFTNDKGETYQGIPLDARDYSVTPLSELANTKEFCNTFSNMNFAYTTDTNTGYISAYGMPLVMGYMTVGSKQVDLDGPKNADPSSTMTWSAYSLDDDYIENAININYVRKDNSQTVNGRINFAGTGYVVGFEPKTYNYALDEFHIFNAGVYDADALGDENQFFLYDGPVLKKYLVYGVGENLTLGIPENISTKEFNKENIRLLIHDDKLPYMVNMMSGYIFLEENATEPYDENGYKWELRPVYDASYEDPFTGEMVPVQNYDEPQVGKFLPGPANQEDGWKNEWGMEFVYDGIYHSPENAGFVILGSTEGVVFEGLSPYDDLLSIEPFKGDVIYHYDEQDMTQVRNLSAVGKYVYNSGVTEIGEVAGGINAIFDLNGRRVNGQLEKGLYIKVVDGKASKILVK